MKNPDLEIALRELAQHGIRDIERSFGSKHLQIRWRVNNGPMRMYSMALTPSDHRSALNTRAGIRRLLREDGVIVNAPKPQPAIKTEPKIEPTAQQRLPDIEQRLTDIEQRLTNLEAPKPRRRKSKDHQQVKTGVTPHACS
jgi:hypothetical protein